MGKKTKTPKNESFCSIHSSITKLSYGAGWLVLGSKLAVREYSDNNKLDVLIDLTGMATASFKVRFTAGLKALLPSLVVMTKPSHEIIAFDWPDQGVLEIPEAFFSELHHQVYDCGLTVGVHCHAGHGRTGTFIAALMSRKYGHEALCYLREIYCDSAVEAKAQIEYLRKIGAAKLTDKQSNAGFASSGFVGTPTHTPTPPTPDIRKWLRDTDITDKMITDAFERKSRGGARVCAKNSPCVYHATGGAASQHCGADIKAGFKASTAATTTTPDVIGVADDDWGDSSDSDSFTDYN